MSHSSNDFSNHLQESPKNPMLRLYIATILGISMGHFPWFFPSIFPIHLFQVGIPYLCLKLFAGPVELRDPLPLQRYGLAGDSAVQVMTTRPGGKGWENHGKMWGKAPNHGKCGENHENHNLADHFCVMNFVGVLSHPSLFHKLMENEGRS